MIDADKWERVKEIVERASELPASEVEGFIQESCGHDQEILTEVRSLLGHVTKSRPNAASPSDIGPGTILGRRYRIRQRLGTGGFAVTWLAEDLDLHDRRVVIKIPSPLDTSDSWFEEKFRNEIAALSSLNHPGIVSPLDIGRLPDGALFLVIEYVEGKTLREVIDSGMLSPGRIADIWRQMGRALSAVRSANIYHRDLKPENVMVQTTGDGADYVRLIDFGIATITAGPELTVHTRAAGSLRYMAPEQLLGQATPTTDVYAFGVIATEMVATLGQSASTEQIRRLLDKARDPIPKNRPADIALLAEQLATALTSGAPRRAWTVWAATATVIALIVVGVIFTLRRGAESSDPPPPPTRTMAIEIVTEGSGTPLAITGRSLVLTRTDRFRLQASSPETGHLYVFAESPSTGVLNILFPSDTANGGSSVILASREQRIPEEDWLEFGGPGTDRLWLAWSVDPHEPFELARRWATAKTRGQITDENEKKQIQTLLSQAPDALQSEAARVVLSGDRALLIAAIDIHHD